MDFKKTLLVILTFIVCMFSLMLASSYAWYSFTKGSTTFDTVTNNEDINVTYTTGMYIDTKTAVPIKKEEIPEYSEKNKFSISLNRDDLVGRILINVSLTNINIDDLLKNENFKYDLLYNEEIIESGNFSQISNKEKFKLANNIILDEIDNNDFELRIYLLDNDSNQNDLMNKTFQGTISINAISRLKNKIEQTGVDILINNITIDGNKSNNLPKKGTYKMTAACKKGSKLTWEPISKTITYENGSKIKDTCSLTFTKNNSYDYKLLNSMKIGSYVKYTGDSGKVGNTTNSCQVDGSATSTVDDAATESPNSCLGENAREDLENDSQIFGYCTNSNEKYHETGWRIAYINNEKTAIISAGSPECISIPDKSKTKEITNTKALKYCNSNYVDGNCTCDDTNNDGLCDISSKDTWNINETDFNKITSALTGKGRKLTILSKIEADYCYNIFSNPYCGYNNSILDNGGTYIFTTDTTNLIVWQKRHVTINNNNLSYGIRPIISLSKNIKVTGGTGTIEDPYTISK